MEYKIVAPADMPVSQTISVVIPVYNAPDEVECCLRSVRATVPPGTQVIVIDDASPDVTTRALLETWAQMSIPGWVFKANAHNLGFVATANRGMQLSQNDVVLLNSDTEVTQGWLQGLHKCLASDSSIATATPWTNNGEIVSIPEFCQANPIPPDPQAVARVLGEQCTVTYPDMPTAVGFCMAISRSAIEQIGLFDAELFGRGYGEENDFSMRVVQAGLRNVLCSDVYVVHLGGRSFAPLGLKPDESSMQKLLSRHPDYLARVQKFITEDPLSGLRLSLLNALQQSGVSLG
jgi:GT2 family glycosyltransferase